MRGSERPRVCEREREGLGVKGKELGCEKERAWV